VPPRLWGCSKSLGVPSSSWGYPWGRRRREVVAGALPQPLFVDLALLLSRRR
jgi:hypothetical protein